MDASPLQPAESEYGGIPRVGAKRRYIDISYSLNPGFSDPPSVSAVGRLGDDESSECGTVVHLDPTMRLHQLANAGLTVGAIIAAIRAL